MGKRLGMYAVGALLIWFAGRYVLGLVFPFLLGWGIALLARPVALGLEKRFGVPAKIGGALAVAITVLLWAALLAAAVFLLVWLLGKLALYLPDLQQTLQQGLSQGKAMLSRWTPPRLKGLLGDMLNGKTFGGERMLTSLVSRLPNVLASGAEHLSRWAVSLATAVLSAFLIAQRLPKIQAFWKAHAPQNWESTILPALKQGKATLFGWGKAQLKLMGVTYLVVGVGLWILQVPYGFVWALGVALVDAVPMLGTGTVLLPWALVCLLQRNVFQAVGLGVIFLLAFLLRTALEPKLVGRHIGLDPLSTLFAIYLGFRLWGIWGMILFPLLGAVGKTVGQGIFKKNS